MALEINGTTGISGLDGSAGAPPLTGTDSNTGISFGSDIVNINTGGTERIRVGGTGVFQLGQNTTNTVGYGNTTVGFTILPDGRFFSSMGGTFSQINRNTTGAVLSFGYQSTGVGQISIGTSSTGYGTSSDYRLKENEKAITDGITRLKTLKPYRFNFKKEKDLTLDGFFAHEVTAVPEAIFGTKDEVDSENNPVYQNIDQSKLVPLLTAALQEAVAKIETLESKVAVLEAA